LGYRSVSDRITSLSAPPSTVISFNPSARTYDTVSLFAQDELELTESLFLTLGSKLQWNDFTDSEVQPTARLLYSPEPSWALWSAVSRAVRTPSRIESDGTIAAGAIPFLQFRPSFYSEDMIAYEIGYRSQPQPYFSWDLAMFFNQYENLGSYTATPVTVFPIFNTNRNRGEGYGFELSSTLDMTSRWRLMAYYAFLQLQIHPGAGTIDFLGSAGSLTEGSSPHNQVLLMSTHDLPGNFELDFVGRYVDNLPIQRVPAYTTLDIRLAWHPHRLTEIAVVGQNLLDPLHPEYGLPPSEIKRGVYGMLTRRW
jgi:iron complex outermembrane receptor protein